MYFITSSKPGIFLIGIYESRLYGFGESKNNKLCIYSKSVFDTGDWEEFLVIDIEPVKAECCETGLHVAAGICDRTISIAARGKKLTHVFLIHILTKRLMKCKMLEEIYEEYKVPDFNLCCNCLLPVIRYQGFKLSFQSFIITPRRYQNETGIFRMSFFISASRHCLLMNSLTPFFLPSPLSSNIAVNLDGEALFVSEKSEDGRIINFSVHQNGEQLYVDIPDDSPLHDIIFFHESLNGMFCVTRTQSDDDDNVDLCICRVRFSMENSSIKLSGRFSFTVDADFPSFESSPIFLSYHMKNVKNVSSLHCSRKLSPDFIVFQTSAGIVTVPLRMLTLRESAYMSLRQLPEPPKLKQPTHPWMSLDSIKKTLGLPSTFQLL